MTTEDKEEIKAIIESTIDEKVNYKIDRLHLKIDEHILEMTPIMDLIKGSKVAQKVVLWITSTILAVGAAVIMIKTMIK